MSADQAFLKKVSRATCPKCHTKGRMLAGPFYARGRLVCTECGARAQVKSPDLTRS